MTAIRIVVADDQPLVRAGIVMLLRAEPDIEVVAEACDGAGAIDSARRSHPDLVLMDVRMPGVDGVAATRQLTEDGAVADRPVRVLVLTTFDDDEAVYGSLRAGASGYVLKHAAPQDLIAAVRRVVAGDAWLDPAVAGRGIAALAATDPLRDDPPELVARLTVREREILARMAEGLDNAELCARFNLAETTVKTHVNRILMKTGARTRTAAVVLAYQSGLVVPRRR